MKTNRGVYIIADDSVIHFLVALLNSLRYHNSRLNICIIPFNDQTIAIRQLQEHYSFDIFSDKELLIECDRLSMLFHGAIRGYYRKFAAWFGKFESFIYLDSDIVVTKSLDPLFSLLSTYDFIFNEGPAPGNRRFVWKDSIYTIGVLTADQIEFAANAGFFASKKNVLRWPEISLAAQQARLLVEHMDLGSSDQAFLNYLVVTSGRRYSSLCALREDGQFKKVGICWWGGARGGIVLGSQIYAIFWKSKFCLGTLPVSLVHWAGANTKIDRKTSWYFDLLSHGFADSHGDRITFMRYRKLWDYYANGFGLQGKRFTVANLSTAD